MFKIYFLLFLLTNLVSYIWAADNNSFSNTEVEQFKGYWYQGKAELTRYQLEQARYGEVHSGDAVIIFVTECFLPDKQVKHEHSQFNSTSVLKMNSSRKFFTGIYPYSILTSVFTPVAFNEEIHSLKVTSSTQEWCGQTYVQLNLRNGEYKGLLHSYFQNEADQHFELKASNLEDEIWTHIRLSPGTLPIGDIEIIPGISFIRLKHIDYKTYSAFAELSSKKDPAVSDNEIKIYTLTYKDLNRILKIKFENKFPFPIVGWEETYESGWGKNTRELTTRAIRTNTIFTDYWSKNSVSDSTYRKELGL